METLGLKYMDIAEYIIGSAHECGDSISNLKLQKIMYYAQAWFIANYGKSLFKENFEAWAHGTVLPELYREMKVFSYHDIEMEISLQEKIKILGKEVVNFLNEVLFVYMRKTAYEMEMMTHIEKPWVNARGNLSPEEKCDRVISKKAMKEFYGKRIKKNKD